MLSSYQKVSSRNGLSSGFGKPEVENLDISMWFALDSAWDWADHCHFDFCLSPLTQQGLYLLFLTVLLKSSSEGRSSAFRDYMNFDGHAALSEASLTL